MLRLRVDAELVKLKECGNTAEAALTRALLESNGIECLIGGEQIRAILGPIENSAVPVLVRAGDLPRARELLEAESQPVDEAELVALAEASAELETEARMEQGTDKPVDPRQAERERWERQNLRFISGGMAVVLGLAWGLLKVTGTSVTLLLVLAGVALLSWVNAVFRERS
jgi:hypothetical protein